MAIPPMQNQGNAMANEDDELNMTVQGKYNL